MPQIPTPPPEPPALIQPLTTQEVEVDSHTSYKFGVHNSAFTLQPQFSQRVAQAGYGDFQDTEVPVELNSNQVDASATSLGSPISIDNDSEAQPTSTPSTVDNPPDDSEQTDGSFSLDQDGTQAPITKPSEVASPTSIPLPVTPPPRQSPSQTLTISGLDQTSTDHKSSETKLLRIRERQGQVREFTIAVDSIQGVPSSQPPELETPLLVQETSETMEVEEVGVVEVISDRQEYDEQRQIITARGNVVVRFPKGVMRADLVKVNLPNRIAVAEGNVVLRRGEQDLRGSRFEYYFVQDNGVIFNAEGEFYQPTLARDIGSGVFREDPTFPDQPLGENLARRQPLQRITTAEGYKFTVGSIRDLSLIGEQGGLPTTGSGGEVNRLRFAAERVDFDSEGWDATKVRLTNDPFSPPELEVRADTAQFRSIAPQVDQLTTTNSRLVLDQWLSVPIFQDRQVFDRRPRQPGVFSIGFDGQERGGLFIERSVNVIDKPQVSFTLTPQYFIQSAFFPDSFADSRDNTNPSNNPLRPQAFGLRSDLKAILGPRTDFSAGGTIARPDVDNFEDKARASIRLNQKVGTLDSPHNFSLQYNFRERLFNGSLGFQNVFSSIGAVVTSPLIDIGDTGATLRYQGSIQNVNASTDRRELLDDSPNDRTTLMRYQGAAILSKNFFLWVGEALPPTPEEGLRYSPTPVQPFLQFTTGLVAVASFYGNGDSQPTLSGRIGLRGQLGHFSRQFFDYTAFNISYSNAIRGDLSPFRFDRFADREVVSLSFTQQVYGPVRAGLQTSFNLNRDDDISTDLFFEYSRRTHSIILRYNPTLQIGSINLRISDFNWVGDAEPFEGSGVRPVIDGVVQ